MANNSAISFYLQNIAAYHKLTDSKSNIERKCIYLLN